ncbi:unnamed protein product [Durusdinium trenchii]|uniref:Uncharacterized protein n=1 Tax=Durusdinium trenchii TaxID=1381693 RepID=A0ABP0IV91_9DINO
MVSRSMRDVAPVAPKHLFLRALACGLAPRFMEVRKFGDGTLRPLWKKTEVSTVPERPKNFVDVDDQVAGPAPKPSDAEPSPEVVAASPPEAAPEPAKKRPAEKAPAEKESKPKKRKG